MSWSKCIVAAVCIACFFCSCASEEQKIQTVITDTKLLYQISFVSVYIQKDKATVHTKESCFIIATDGGWKYWKDAPITYHLEKISGKWRIIEE